MTAAKLLLPNVRGCSNLAKMLIQKFVQISIPDLEYFLSWLNSDDTTDNTDDTADNTDDTADNADNMAGNSDDIAKEGDFAEVNDSVYAYAVDILTMGLLWYGFQDAGREGDADRIVMYYSYI